MDSGAEDNYQKKERTVLFDLKGLSDAMNSLNIQVSPKDLKNPSQETLLKVYKSFIETCFSYDVFNNELTDIALHFNDEDAKAYADSFKFMQLHVIAKYLLEFACMKPSFDDIWNPSKSKFIKYMSAIVNFFRYEFCEIKDFQVVSERVKVYLDNCEAIAKEKEELMAKNYALKSERTEKKILIENAKKRVAALKERVAMAREIKKKQQEKVDCLKKEREALLAEKAEITAKSNGVQNKLNVYEKLIVKSPTRLKQDSEKNEERISELERENELKRNQIEEIKKDIFHREKFTESYKQILENLRNFFKHDVENANSQMKKIDRIKEEIVNFEFELKQWESQLNTSESNKAKVIKTIELLVNDFTDKFNEEQDKSEAYEKSTQDNDKLQNEVDMEIRIAVEEKKITEDRCKTFLETVLANTKQICLNKKTIEAAFKAKMETLACLSNYQSEHVDHYNKLMQKAEKHLEDLLRD